MHYRPYLVLLFDKMEKAHLDVFNVMLQMLNNDMVADSKGRAIDFKNYIIIFTSTIASQDIIDLGPLESELMCLLCISLVSIPSNYITH